jgi:mRNA interferase HigB
VRIIAKRTLREYWEQEPRAEQPLKSWYAIASKADWSSPMDVKHLYGTASIVGNDRVVFNIKGKHYRFVVMINYTARIVYVRFIGTGAEYDEIGVEGV